MELHHAGVATDAADELAELYADALGLAVVHEETDPEKGLRFRFLEVGEGFFELIEPIDDDSVIGRYLASNGPGLHHVALETDDIEAALRAAKAGGIELIDETPRAGAWGHEIAFLHPRSTGGCLLEFVQPS